MALPVTIVVIVVLALFVLITSIVLEFKPASIEGDSRFDLSRQHSRVLSDLILRDSIFFSTQDTDFPTVRRYTPSFYDGLSTSSSFETSDALNYLALFYSRSSGTIPYEEKRALFLPFETLIDDIYGCDGANSVKFFIPQSGTGLGSSPGMVLLYDYPARSWEIDDGLPKLELFSSEADGSQPYPFDRLGISEDSFVTSLESGAYLVVRGSVPC